MKTPSRRILLECFPLYYPFGNTGVQDIFKDFNFENIGDEIKVWVSKQSFIVLYLKSILI
jgi:hypothetical protein